MKITDYTSLYAALLSTFLFAWQIKNSRAKVKVNLILGASEVGEIGVYLFVRNISNYEVHINSVSLLYPYERLTFFKKIKRIIRYRHFRNCKYSGWVHTDLVFKGIATGLPISIQPRKSHEIFIPKDNIKKSFSKNYPSVIVASCQDALWNDEYSEVFDISNFIGEKRGQTISPSFHKKHQQKKQKNDFGKRSQPL